MGAAHRHGYRSPRGARDQTYRGGRSFRGTLSGKSFHVGVSSWRVGMKSARLFLGSFLFLFSGVIAAIAQDRPTVSAQANTVYVGSEGKFQSPPDTALIQFNVSVQDDTSQAAFSRASKNVEQVREVLRANGIDPKAANIGFLSVQPVYEWKPKKRVIGYRVTTDATLKLKDFAKVAPITQQLADANVSETQTLSYTLENIDDAKNRAVEDAYRRARNSADTLARAS